MSWTITPSQALPDDPDAAAYIAAVEAADTAGGQTGGLEPATRLAINSFVKGCKADGIWSAIKASCILAGARTLSGALVPLVGAAPTNNNFVSGNYNRKTGLVGDGAADGPGTKYLSSNRANNTDPQNNQHISVYVSVAPTNQSYIFGDGHTSSGATNMSWYLGNFYSRSRNSGALTGMDNSLSTGLIGLSRSSSSQYLRRKSQQNTIASQASEGPSSGVIDFYRDSVAGSGGTTNARLAFYSIGESLDLTLLDARVSALITAFAAAIP